MGTKRGSRPVEEPVPIKIEGQARWEDFKPEDCTVASSLRVCSHHHRDFSTKLTTQIVTHREPVTGIMNKPPHSEFYGKPEDAWKSAKSEFCISGSGQDSICAIPSGKQCRAMFTKYYGNANEFQSVTLLRHELC